MLRAEHGGFYRAVATGIYKKYGLDVTIRGWRPAGQRHADPDQRPPTSLMGYDLQVVLKGIEQACRLPPPWPSFQSDLQGLMTHEDVKGLADLGPHHPRLDLRPHHVVAPG